MATNRAPMLAAARSVPFRVGYYTCCTAHAPWGTRRGLVRRNRTREADAWRSEVDAPGTDLCGCACHAECIAGMEPFCLGCDSDYANLCAGEVPWRPHRPTYAGVPC